ncbi:MAG: hypothetical protein ACI9OI_002469 [Chitinophagales bacterium]|jgi:hypothetical protein
MINFNLQRTKSYQEIQKKLNSIVQRHLPESTYSESKAKRVEEALNFSWFIRLKSDVLISHGVADKNYYWMTDKETGEKYVNGLKALLVPGEWSRSRVLKSPSLTLTPDQVISVGWPRLDELRELQASVTLPSISEKISILWAPTHDFVKRGVNKKSTSSYPDFEPFAEKLSKDFKVDSSLHPRNRKDKEPTLDKLLRSNVVISDFGTLVYEAWALGKPVIFPRWILGDSIETYLPGSAEAHIFRNRIGYHPDSFEELLELIATDLVITSDVDSFMDAYLDNYRGGSGGKKVAKTLLYLEKKYAQTLVQKAKILIIKLKNALKGAFLNR